VTELSLSELIQNCERIAAEDAAVERRLTVPQEPWPEDGTFPAAAHYLTYRYPETGEEEVKWTGVANGLVVACITRGLVGKLRVHPSYVPSGNELDLHLRLVDEQGKTRALAVQRLSWWL
jgi:hypothetical protein